MDSLKQGVIWCATFVCLVAIASSAGAAPVQVGIGAFSGSETVHDFEAYQGNVDILTNQLIGFGVTFNAIPIEPHIDYGSTFANAVKPFAGDKGLFQGLKAGGEVIAFTSPVTRVGFHFGSNVPVNVPFETYLGAVKTGSFNLNTAANTMPFFGFQDFAGIDRIVFLRETTHRFVSQIDNLRFAVPEPHTLALLGLAAGGLIVRRRRKQST